MNGYDDVSFDTLLENIARSAENVTSYLANDGLQETQIAIEKAQTGLQDLKKVGVVIAALLVIGLIWKS
jgi:hypothetical protein